MTDSIDPTDGSDLIGIDQVLADPAASVWLKVCLKFALRRDPVDAANDADILSRLLNRQCREILTVDVSSERS